MGFNVYFILLYAAVCIGAFFCVKVKFRPICLLLASFAFYGLNDWKFAILMALEIAITFYFGRSIENSKSKKILAFGIVVVLAILGFFKYFNFFTDAFGFSAMKILLPLGISYYSFKAISYMADIYLGKRKAERSLVNYGCYIAFFPQLMCGPIARSQGMLEQLKNGVCYNAPLFQQGIILVISGLFKKVVIADRVADYVNVVFANPTGQPSLALILAAFLYAVQLYCDFAGYSEIAIGLTNMFGIKCDPNFLRPYFALSIRDFWRRWHISLSSWLRDYIYIPLGGNRCKKQRNWFNVLVTFVACGIWHGSSFHFVAWGTYHGILNLLTPRKIEGKLKGLAKFTMWLLTFILVVIGWVVFRVENMSDVSVFFASIVNNFSISVDSIGQSLLPFTGSNTCVSYFLITMGLVALLFIKELREERNKRNGIPWVVLQLAAIILLGFTGSSAFLYANF